MNVLALLITITIPAVILVVIELIFNERMNERYSLFNRLLYIDFQRSWPFVAIFKWVTIIGWIIFALAGLYHLIEKVL